MIVAIVAFQNKNPIIKNIKAKIRPAIKAKIPFNSNPKKINFNSSIGLMWIIPLKSPITPANVLMPLEKKKEMESIARVGIIQIHANEA